MKKRNFLEFFEGIEGGLSFKRLQTCVFVLLFAIIVISNLFWGLMISEYLLEILSVMILYGYTGIVAEKFSKRGMTSIAANDQAMLIETKATVEKEKAEIPPTIEKVEIKADTVEVETETTQPLILKPE